jgi:S-DNA-T family DNA segregation ATPase FtsK/SpoIIIE
VTKRRLLEGQVAAKRPRRSRRERVGRRGLEPRPAGRAAGVVWIAAAMFLAFTLGGWQPGAGFHAWTGPAGAALGRSLLGLLGLTAFCLPPLLLVRGVRRLSGARPPVERAAVICAGLLGAGSAGLLHVLDRLGHNPLWPELPLLGGDLGRLVGGPLLRLARPTGASVVLLGVLGAAAVYAFWAEFQRLGPFARMFERLMAWVGVLVLRLLVGGVNGMERLGSGLARAGVAALQGLASALERLRRGSPAEPLRRRSEPLGLLPAAPAEVQAQASEAAPLRTDPPAQAARTQAAPAGETARSLVALRPAPRSEPMARFRSESYDAGFVAAATPGTLGRSLMAAARDLHTRPLSAYDDLDEEAQESGLPDGSVAAPGLDPPAGAPRPGEDPSASEPPLSGADLERSPWPTGSPSGPRSPAGPASEATSASRPGADAVRPSRVFDGLLWGTRPSGLGGPSRPDSDEEALIEPFSGPVAEEVEAAEADPDIEPAYAPAGRRYELPSLDHLADPPPENHQVLEEELRENSRLLLAKLNDFGVQGTIACIRPGPVITRYEFEPAPGIKITKITGLADDLALALKAVAPPRVAPIPKSSALGIELPNHHRETVHFKNIVASEAYRQNPSLLRLALGVDIAGHPYVADLARMPHLLIAGATGSGKSVCINTLLLSLLMSATPEQVQLLLIDPKMLELSIYNEVPHLLEDVVTEPKKAAAALAWAVREMEERYKKLSRRRVRNISQYNETVEREPIPAPTRNNPDPEVEYPLPYVVIVIDELADLMMVAGNEVESAITRLAQMARAAGIHLVLATQRPSVDVITGSIKANFPCRISFKVATKVDSRTVLDGNGAEKLLGRGDLFFIAPGTSAPLRIHGCFLGEEDILRVVEHWRPQPPLERKGRSIFEAPAEAGEDKDFAAQDELYEPAVRFIVESGHASISLLQRRLRVGHARAARLIDMMEQDGVVGPFEGSKPREVLWKPEQLPEAYGVT